MKFSDFTRIFKRNLDVFKKIDYVILGGMGEVFCASQLDKVIDLLGDYRIPIILNTNGTLLPEKIIKILKKNYFIKFIISIDGAKPASYNENKLGSDYGCLIKNVRKLVELKKQNNLYRTTIVWQFIVFKNNESEIEHLKISARKIGVDKLVIRTARLARGNSRQPTQKKYQTKNNHALLCEKLAMNELFIFWNGDVVPCCHDYGREYLLGNAYAHKLTYFLRSRKYKDFLIGNMRKKNTKCIQCGFDSKVEIEKIVFTKEAY